MHFTLIVLQENLLVVQLPEQLQETNRTNLLEQCHLKSLWVQIVQHLSHTAHTILDLWPYFLKVSNPVSVDMP